MKCFIPKDLLSSTCRTPKQLIEYFGRTRFVLKPLIIHDDDEWDKNTRVYKTVPPMYMRLPIFVKNRIPSNIYRIKNPRMVIKKHKKTHYRYVKDSQTANTQMHGENDLISPAAGPNKDNLMNDPND